MKDKRVSGNSRGGWRRHGDRPAWLDDTLPLEERRRLLDIAIHAASASQPRAAVPQRKPDDTQKPSGEGRQPED